MCRTVDQWHGRSEWTDVMAKNPEEAAAFMLNSTTALYVEVLPTSETLMFKAERKAVPLGHTSIEQIVSEGRDG